MKSQVKWKANGTPFSHNEKKHNNPTDSSCPGHLMTEELEICPFFAKATGIFKWKTQEFNMQTLSTKEIT